MGQVLYLFKKEVILQADKSQARFEELLESCTLGRKANTKDKCKYVLKRWIEYYGYVEEPTEKHALQYIDHARTKLKLSNKTIKTTLQLLKRLYQSSVFDKAISLIKVNHKRPEKRNCEYIPFNQVNRLLQIPDILKPSGRRDRCLIALMLGGGLRISEALDLNIEDVKETNQGTLYLLLKDTKKGYPDEQVISPEMANIVKEYVAERLLSSLPNAPLLTSYSKEGKYTPLDIKTDRCSMAKRFRGYVKKTGLMNITPHSCRRTSITKLLSDGLTYREVQSFSRHESVDMVELYDKRAFGKDDSIAKKLRF